MLRLVAFLVECLCICLLWLIWWRSRGALSLCYVLSSGWLVLIYLGLCGSCLSDVASLGNRLGRVTRLLSHARSICIPVLFRWVVGVLVPVLLLVVRPSLGVL